MSWEYVDCIIVEKSIHKSKYFISSTFVNDLINIESRIIVFWTSLIEIPIVGTYSNGSLFLFNRNNIRYSFI